MAIRFTYPGYVNTLPLTHRLQANPNFSLHPGIPTQINRAFFEGEADVALISSIEALRRPKECVLLSPYCIAAKERIMSVCLYCRLPIASLSGKPLFYTMESATSVALLQLLCRHHWKISPEWIPSQNPYQTSPDAFLLIGDRALQKPSFPGYTTYDLASCWYEMTGLPFVFALLCARKRSAETDQLLQELDLCLKWALANPQTIVKTAAEKTGLASSVLEKYFKSLIHHLGPEEERGLATFGQLLEQTTGKAHV